MRVSVILPTMGRAEQALRCIERMRATAGHPFELVVVVEVDETGYRYLRERLSQDDIVLFRAEHKGPVYGWNEGAAAASGGALMLAGDDLEPEDGWLTTALSHFSDTVGFVGLNDGYWDGEQHFATHFLATRDHLMRVQGGCLAIPVYKHYSFDVEMTFRARAAGEYAWARDAVVRHDHPYWGTRQWDDTYLRGKPWAALDKKLFYRRQTAGWPTDYEPILVQDEENQSV